MHTNQTEELECQWHQSHDRWSSALTAQAWFGLSATAAEIQPLTMAE